MRLSKLQNHIITTAYFSRQANCQEKDFFHFYSDRAIKEQTKIVRDTIHKSLDNLVEKDLLVAYGHKTARKWFIQKVRLTGRGRKLATRLIKVRQQKLGLK